VMDLLNRDCSALRSLWGFPLRPLPSPNQQLLRTDRLPGCCMLIRPELFEHVGMFDEKYFLYWEEIDFCLRARSAGHELLINRDIAIVHRGDGIGTLKRHRVYYTWRNQVRFAFKNYGRLLGLLFLMRRLFITNLRELITYLCCGRPSLLLAGMAGLWAALVGEAGHSESCHAAPEREIA
jgi:GT2 family glycosyltransferase